MSSHKEDTMPSAPYSYRRPSPPFIHIPVVQRYRADCHDPLDMIPSHEHMDPDGLTSEDMAIITGNVVQVATDRAGTWSYEQRREAQSILDFLYLGPTSVIRDFGFLKGEGITMLLVVRDVRLAKQSLASVDRAVASLNVKATYLDIESSHELVRIFPLVVRQINGHLLDVYRNQMPGSNTIRRGKVLVTCETGNDRSAAVVAAYLMSMFHKDMVTTIQFISMQRFCCGFDEDLKRALLAWDDILTAQSAVARDSRETPIETGPALGDSSSFSVSLGSRSDSKRRLDDIRDDADDNGNGADDAAQDHERFAGRDAFIPFMDVA